MQIQVAHDEKLSDQRNQLGKEGNSITCGTQKLKKGGREESKKGQQRGAVQVSSEVLGGGKKEKQRS